MKFSDLEESAVKLNELYEELAIKMYGRAWTTEQLALGFVEMSAIARQFEAYAPNIALTRISSLLSSSTNTR